MVRLCIAALCLATLAGCQGMQYAMEEYRDIDMVEFVELPADGQPRYIQGTNGQATDQATTWRIFDKPAESKLMITPSLGAAMGGGAARGLTFGAAGNASPAVMRDAAIRWLATTGRTCTAVETVLVVEPQFEVRYQCDVATIVEAAD